MKKKTTKKKAKHRKPKTKAMVKHEPAGAMRIPQVTDKTIDEYLHLEEKKLGAQHKAMFVKIATMYQLNPIKKEIYAIPRWNKKESRYDLQITMAYDVFLKRAVRTKDLGGWKVWSTGSTKDGNLQGHVEIHRLSWKTSLTHTVDYDEYNQGVQLWVTKPKTMIKKVAIKQGFGMAFPDELGELPNVPEEMPTDYSNASPAVIEKYEKNITPDDGKPQQTKEPEKPKNVSKRDALLATLRGSWNTLRDKDKKKYDAKYYATALGMVGCEKTEDCTDKQIIELTKELDNERKNADG